MISHVTMTDPAINTTRRILIIAQPVNTIGNREARRFRNPFSGRVSRLSNALRWNFSFRAFPCEPVYPYTPFLRRSRDPKTPARIDQRWLRRGHVPSRFSIVFKCRPPGKCRTSLDTARAIFLADFGRRSARGILIHVAVLGTLCAYQLGESIIPQRVMSTEVTSDIRANLLFHDS